MGVRVIENPDRKLRTFLVRRYGFPSQPSRTICFQRVNSEADLFDAAAGAAFKGSFFIAAFARRNPGQSHPLFTDGTHWSLDTMHQDTPVSTETI
jgi:hypothetical protein